MQIAPFDLGGRLTLAVGAAPNVASLEFPRQYPHPS
jgi:hypothetical protein